MISGCYRPVATGYGPAFVTLYSILKISILPSVQSVQLNSSESIRHFYNFTSDMAGPAKHAPALRPPWGFSRFLCPGAILISKVVVQETMIKRVVYTPHSTEEDANSNINSISAFCQMM